MKGSKHKEHLPNVFSQSFFKNNKTVETIASAKKTTEFSCKQSSIDSCTSRTLVINAKIMWVLHVVMWKYSFNLNSKKNEPFATMISDGEVAKAFPFGKRKCSSIENYSVAPYFLEVLNTQLMELEHSVALMNYTIKLRSNKWTFISNFGLTLKTLLP